MANNKPALAKALYDYVAQFKNPLEGAEAAKKIMRPYGSFRVSGINPKDYASLIEKLGGSVK